MTKTVILSTILLTAIAAVGVTLALLPPESSMAFSTGEHVSVTVTFDDVELKPGELMVLLDTSASGTLSVVHVAANLPCESSSGPNPGGGDDSPDVTIFAGSAVGTLAPVIDPALTSQDTGFIGPEKTCVFHGTIGPGGVGGIITDVIVANFGTSDVDLKQVTVTITGTYV